MTIVVMNNSDHDDDDYNSVDYGDNYNIYYLPVWTIVDDKEMITIVYDKEIVTTGNNWSILEYH